MQHFRCCVVRPQSQLFCVVEMASLTLNPDNPRYGDGGSRLVLNLIQCRHDGLRTQEDVRLAFRSAHPAHVIAGLTRNLHYSVFWR